MQGNQAGSVGIAAREKIIAVVEATDHLIVGAAAYGPGVPGIGVAEHGIPFMATVEQINAQYNA